MDANNGNNQYDELIKINKKILRSQRMATICIAAMVIVLLASVLYMVPKVTITLNHVNDVAIKAEASLEEADKLVVSLTDSSEQLETAIASLDEACRSIDEFVDQNNESATEAVSKISQIDFDGLNKAIQDLQDTVGPFANFFNKFK